MLVEKLAKAVRRGRSDAEKDAAEAAAERAAAGSTQGDTLRPSPKRRTLWRSARVIASRFSTASLRTNACNYAVFSSCSAVKLLLMMLHGPC